VIEWTEFGRERFDRRAAVTLGVFDGVHRGHLRLLDSVAHADFPIVVTFRESPAQYLFPESFPGRLMTLPQRLACFDRCGIELVVLIDFTEEFASIPGDRFLDTLEGSLDIDVISIGWNFRCGRGNDTGATDIRERFDSHRVLIHDPVTRDGAPVSSTRLRELISRGEYDRFSDVSGRAFSVDVEKVERTDRDGRVAVELDDRGRVRHTTQLVGPPGKVHGQLIGKRRHEIDVEIGRQYLDWPLVDDDTIDYIVLNKRREKET
jgi:FAD synthase